MCVFHRPADALEDTAHAAASVSGADYRLRTIEVIEKINLDTRKASHINELQGEPPFDGELQSTLEVVHWSTTLEATCNKIEIPRPDQINFDRLADWFGDRLGHRYN